MDYILPQSFRGQVSLLATDLTPLVGAQSCKDYVHDSLTHYFYPDYGRKYAVSNYLNLGKKLDEKHPAFAYYCSPKNVEKNAEKFVEFINKLEDSMDIEGRTIAAYNGSGATEKAAPFVVAAAPFWIKSPVAVSAFLTFLRMSIFMRKGESLSDFVKRHSKTSEYTDRDSGYLRKANKKKNIQGLIERTMPALNREGYSDYLLSNHGRGFSGYNAGTDIQPLDENGLLAYRGLPTKVKKKTSKKASKKTKKEKVA